MSGDQALRVCTAVECWRGRPFYFYQFIGTTLFRREQVFISYMVADCNARSKRIQPGKQKAACCQAAFITALFRVRLVID